jgi:periplasmic protein TonB
LSLAGTIWGMESGARLASLSVSIILHTMVLITIPVSLGELGSGPAQSESALHITVERNQLSDRQPLDQAADSPMLQAAAPPTPADTPEPDNAPQPEGVEQAIQPEEPAVTPEPEPRRRLLATATEEEWTAVEPVKTAIKAVKPEPTPPPTPAVEPVVDPEPRPDPVAATPANPSPAAVIKSSRSKVKQKLQLASKGSTRRLSRDYRSTLLRLIERNKYYPLRARRRAMEGKALVRFTVQRNGQIRNVSLSRSSRKPLLDQAAVQTIKRMGKAPPLPKGLKRSSWRFVVPISYNMR